MIKNLINSFKSFDKVTHRILKYGLEFCFALSMISVIILLTYNLIFATPSLYYIGISLFKLSLVFGIEFIICSIVVDSIKKQMV